MSRILSTCSYGRHKHNMYRAENERELYIGGYFKLQEAWCTNSFLISRQIASTLAGYPAQKNLYLETNVNFGILYWFLILSDRSSCTSNDARILSRCGTDHIPEDVKN